MTSRAQQLTLIAQLERVLLDQRSPPLGYQSRTTAASDQTSLSDLYLAAYSPEVVASRDAADAELQATFAGEYGRLDLAASPVLTYGDEVVASVTVVEQAPWPDTPAGPFIIEVMVHPGHRRRGLAESAIQLAARSLLGRNTSVALRVMSDNVGAMALYRKLGFAEFVAEDAKK